MDGNCALFIVKVKRREHPVQHAVCCLRVEHELLIRVGDSVITRQRDIRSIKHGTARSVYFSYIDAKQPISVAQLHEEKK
jgi:hypothetical protein